jgi:hypothetical protein
MKLAKLVQLIFITALCSASVATFAASPDTHSSGNNTAVKDSKVGHQLAINKPRDDYDDYNDFSEGVTASTAWCKFLKAGC